MEKENFSTLQIKTSSAQSTQEIKKILSKLINIIPPTIFGQDKINFFVDKFNLFTPEENLIMMNLFNKILTDMVERESSDIEFGGYGADGYIWLRTFGKKERIKEMPQFTIDEFSILILNLLTDNQRRYLLVTKNLDFSYTLNYKRKQRDVRFRANIYFDFDSLALNMRSISLEVRPIESLEFHPNVIRVLSHSYIKFGITLITGITGSGKSSTLDSIIDYHNKFDPCHIIIIASPLEYVHKSKVSIVRHREVGKDVLSFKEGVIQSLRQDPDIIVIGEMRDPETIMAALEVADTGHKVFSTLHTSSAVESIDRIIAEVHPSEQERVRNRLADVLTAVVSQKLVPTVNNKLILAKEVLIVTPNVKAAIKNNNTGEIYHMITQGGQLGMITLEQDLKRLYTERRITIDNAIAYANNKTRMQQLLSAVEKMKPVVFVFCEGNDTKFAVCYKENSKLKLLKAASVEVLKEKVSASTSSMDTFNLMQTDTDINIDLNAANNQIQQSGQIFESIVASELSGIKLTKCAFVPILTEPSTYFQIQQEKGMVGITEISETKTLTKTKEIKKSEKKKQKKNEQEITLSDGSKLKVFLSSDIPCFTMLNNLARYYHKRYFKIVSVKNSEISLARYVAKRKKFFPDDYSLIVYIGKEYSKLIFLHGRKLKHIGSTIDIGTSNLNTYDVYFSKILLEMENGNIPILDNIVICGEDVSENIILSLYGSFPEANVSRLEFDDVDYSSIRKELSEQISAFSIPIAVADEYFDELSGKYSGINLLPKYIIEQQKAFQFGWHGYAMLPILFFTAFYITFQILSNQSKIRKLNSDIAVYNLQKSENMQLLSEIESYNLKINTFDQTQAILDDVSKGAGIWNTQFQEISDYVGTIRNLWIRNFGIQENKIKIEGHSLNKALLTKFAAQLDSGIIKNLVYEPINKKDVYRFVINSSLPDSSSSATKTTSK